MTTMYDEITILNATIERYRNMAQRELTSAVLDVLDLRKLAWDMASKAVEAEKPPYVHTGERMNHSFSTFNLHCNDAGKRADAEYIAQFGQDSFDEHIAPRHKEGIMSIFNEKPNMYTMAWVVLVTAYVNEHATEKANG